MKFLLATLVVLYISLSCKAQDTLKGDSNQPDNAFGNSVYKFGSGLDTATMHIHFLSFCASEIYFYLPQKYNNIEKGSKIIIQFADSSQFFAYNNYRNNTYGIIALYYGETYGQVGLQWLFRRRIESICFKTRNGPITFIFTENQGYTFQMNHFFDLSQFRIYPQLEKFKLNKRFVKSEYDTTKKRWIYSNKKSIKLTRWMAHLPFESEIQLVSSFAFERRLPIEINITSPDYETVEYGAGVTLFLSNRDSIKCYSQTWSFNDCSYHLKFTDLAEDRKNLEVLNHFKIAHIKLHAHNGYYDLPLSKRTAIYIRRTIKEFDHIGE